MNLDIGDLLRAIGRALRPGQGEEETAGIMNEKPSGARDRVDIENAITTFKELISKLSENSNEIGELYLSAERKAARYALLSETVIESVTSGILVVDGMHEIRLANSSAKRILGCDENADLAGRRLCDVFGDCKQLLSLVSDSFRTSKNFSRKVIRASLIGDAEICLGVSTSCVMSDGSEPHAIIIVFTQLDRDIIGMVGGGADEGSAALEAYRRGILDAYGIVSEIYTDIEGLHAEIEKGSPDVSHLAQVAERLEFACDLMISFAMSKVASGIMPELVDLNAALKKILSAKGLSGQRYVARLGGGLPRVSTVRRVMDAGLEMLLKGCLVESSDGIEITTRLDRTGEPQEPRLIIRELSPTLPLADVSDQPRGFLGRKGLRRELGLLLLRSLPPKGHALDVSRSEGTFTYSLTFLMPKQNETGKHSTSGGFTDTESEDGEARM